MYENLLANVPTDLWIGGQWRKSSDGQRFDVMDPATEKKVASVASATVDDAIAALDAAQAAFPAWAAKKPRKKQKQPGPKTPQRTGTAGEGRKPVRNVLPGAAHGCR